MRRHGRRIYVCPQEAACRYGQDIPTVGGFVSHLRRTHGFTEDQIEEELVRQEADAMERAERNR